ncbi:MAG: SDR family NAD(P)-dependent oxidoreductase [Christensenellales bacterium]|jgi:short-subunit dehydrogenase
MELKEKKVIITGASTGIGYQVMTRLLARGANVIAVSRKMSKCDYNHENLIKLDLDMSSKESMDKLFDFAVKKFNNIDIFIANAGFGFYEIIDKPDWEHLLEIFNINVFSCIYAAEKMKRLNSDRAFNMVITASAMGYVSVPGYSLYSATKAALRGFSDAYRYELNKNQRLQVVYPIATKTEFFEAAGNIPMSWPVQSVEHVADKMIKGIIKDKKHIHTSVLFKIFRLISTIFPFALKLYNKPNERKLKNYLNRK